VVLSREGRAAVLLEGVRVEPGEVRGSAVSHWHMPPKKKKPCKVCGEKFTPISSLSVACSTTCARVYAAANNRALLERGRQVERAERQKEKRAWRKSSMSLSKLKNLAQREVNRYCRERDANDGCISCHMPASYTGQWHASHYRSRAAAPQLRFDEANIHKSCAQCNSYKSGNLVEYRPRLIAKIGLAEVERLENDNTVKRWTADELIEIRKTYHAKWRALVAAREGKA